MVSTTSGGSPGTANVAAGTTPTEVMTPSVTVWPCNNPRCISIVAHSSWTWPASMPTAPGQERDV